jgi:hypothetical protein
MKTPVAEKTLTFCINAYSPATIPMARLAEYMQEFATLLGNKHGVHFHDLRLGSTQLVARIDREEIPKVDEQLERLSRNEASQEVAKARDEIDRLLSADNATGYIFEGDTPTAQIIRFPGITRPRPTRYGPFKQFGTLDGVLVSVNGTDQTIHIQLQNDQIKYTGIETDRDTARRLAQHFFEPIRVSGNGRWLREENGTWTLKGFRVDSFEVLQNSELSDVVSVLRQIRGSSWSEMEDPLSALLELRDSKDGVH